MTCATFGPCLGDANQNLGLIDELGPAHRGFAKIVGVAILIRISGGKFT